jgi:hypothetical protein
MYQYKRTNLRGENTSWKGRRKGWDSFTVSPFAGFGIPTAR